MFTSTRSLGQHCSVLFFNYVAWLVSVIDFYCPLFVVGVHMCLTKNALLLTCVIIHYVYINSSFDCGYSVRHCQKWKKRKKKIKDDEEHIL
jgi:hypothetical protein